MTMPFAGIGFLERSSGQKSGRPLTPRAIIGGCTAGLNRINQKINQGV